MTQGDLPSQWAGTVQFAVVSTPRRLLLVSYDKASLGDSRWGSNQFIHYLEVDNRGNKGATIFYAPNGQTASSVLSSTFTTSLNAIATLGSDSKQPNFRLPPDSIDRILVRATSISVVATGNATTIFLNWARF